MADEMRARVEDSRDLSGVFSRYKRHIPLVALAIVAGLVLAGVLTEFLPKRYSASAQVTYSPQEISVSDKSPAASQSDAARDAQIEGQVQTVKSLPVLKQVVKNLGLERDPELASGAGRIVGTNDRSTALAMAVLQNLDVRRAGQSTLINITYTDENPAQAAAIANGVVAAYVEYQLGQKRATSAALSQQIDQRADDLRQQAESADNAVAQFRVANNVLDEAGLLSLNSAIAASSTGLAQARAEEAAAATRRSAAQHSIVSGGGMNGPISTAALAQLRQQQAEVSRRVASLSSRYGDKHPLIKDARGELADINGKIDQESARVAQSTSAESTIASSRASSLASSLGALQGRMAHNVRAGVQLAELERRATNARTIYEKLLANSGEERARRALVQPDTRVTSPATVPLRPSSPNLIINLFLGFMVGAGIGLGVSFLRERWTKGLDTVDDIERLLGKEFLNSVPTLKSSVEKPKTKDPIEAVLVHPLSAYTESFRNLATSLTFASKPKTGKVIGITSALPKEGKTTTSIGIARVLAAGGQRVALVDADLRRRSVTEALFPQAAHGMIEVLAGDMTVNQALVQDPSGVMVLPLAPNAHLGTMPFEGAAFETMMRTLRAQFDVVVFDTAPVLAVTDTRILMHHFDAMALLVRWKATPVKAVRAALHQIESVGGNVTGIALSQVNLKTQAEAGYGDPSYYYGYMKDYYTTA